MGAPQVLVVGGGLAGVSAAASLRAAGCSVRVLEREAAPGGRARGAEREGFRLDAAPFLVSARERRLLTLIHEVGLGAKLLPLRPLTIAQAHRGRVEAAPPAGRPIEVARIPGVKLLEALRLRRLARLERRFADLIEPASPERAGRLDDRSVADFVRLYFGASVLERWAEPLLASDLLADAAETSRVCFLMQRAAQGEALPATLRGSPAAIVDALWTHADRSSAEALGVAPDGRQLAVSLRDAADVLRADAVVLALAADATLALAGALLAPAERDLLAGARSAPAIVLTAALERSPHAQGHPAPRAARRGRSARDAGHRAGRRRCARALRRGSRRPGRHAALEPRAAPGGGRRDREGAARGPRTLVPRRGKRRPLQPAAPLPSRAAVLRGRALPRAREAARGAGRPARARAPALLRR